MKKCKALLAGLTALCMCAVYMPLNETMISEISMLSAHAEESGTCGENLTWVLDDEGTLTISGTGKMTDWGNPDDVPWYSSKNKIKKIIIENGVTSIGKYAFYKCTNLTSVNIPNGITKIGFSAFTYCEGLNSVIIPDSVTSIENSVFMGCADLTSIAVSENNSYYTSVNGVLFNKDKTKLFQYPAGNTRKKYTIPDSVTSIGGWAFYDCINLTSIAISSNVTDMGWGGFSGCANLISVEIPNGVTTVEGNAFRRCTNLTSVTIPDSVTSIGSYAFMDCACLTSVTIPENVTNIKDSAFTNCTVLTSITILNSECEIFDSADTICNSDGYTEKCLFSGTIYGYSNSTAQVYAEKYNRTFMDIESIPQREKEFVEGGDNWSFSNSRTNFGDTYFIEDNYYKKLLNGLNNIEKEKIYDTVRNTKWSGSCYGMATTSVLASSSILNPSDYQRNANFLHDISAPPSDEVRSLINYYFMLQFTDNIQNQTRQAAYQSEEEKLKKLIACLEDDSPALLTYFGYFNGSKFNYGGHGVVAYGVEYGTYSKDGKAYNGKILTYDNNAVDYDESYCLYFNTSDWSWVIPYYQLDSTKGSTLGFVSDDVNLLNAHGYLNGGTYQNSASDYIAMLDADTMNADYSIHKVNYSNGTWINAPTAEDDIKLFSSLSDTQETNNLCFALKDAESGYVMEIKTPASMDLSMNYENVLLNSTASKGLNICFSPEGCIFLEGENTNYNMQIVLNESELVTDWYSFSVNGGNTDAVKLEKNKGGYILTSPDMKNIIAEAYNNADDAFINFSTDAESVYLYEIDKNTIGVKIDSNGDGTYDKLIAQTPESITGDANLDGIVDILDVITINKAVLGKETLTRHQNAFSDVNQNGVPDSSDSLAVLKYIVGLTSSLK